MFHKIISKLIFVSVAITMVSCATKKEETASSGVSCTTSSPDHWSTGVSTIVSNSCVSCHSGYSTYSGASAAASSIASQVNSGAMPQGGSLSAADKTSLVQWAACGAPQ